jgi:hypothetical protein
MGDKIDDAFDWLILIMSTMNGVLISLPENLEAKKATAGGVLIPFFVLVMVWLLGHLIKREHTKVILKTFAWFYALLMLGSFGEIFSDQIFGTLRTLNSVFVRYPPLALLFMALFIPFMFGWPIVFFDRLVRPVYKEIYKDSRLLSSRKQLALLYIFAAATFIAQILPFLSLGVFQ